MYPESSLGVIVLPCAPRIALHWETFFPPNCIVFYAGNELAGIKLSEVSIQVEEV